MRSFSYLHLRAMILTSYSIVSATKNINFFKYFFNVLNSINVENSNPSRGSISLGGNFPDTAFPTWM